MTSFLKLNDGLAFAGDATAANGRIPAGVGEQRTDARFDAGINGRLEVYALRSAILTDGDDEGHVHAEGIELFAYSGIEHRIGLLGAERKVPAGLMRSHAGDGARLRRGGRLDDRVRRGSLTGLLIGRHDRSGGGLRCGNALWRRMPARRGVRQLDAMGKVDRWRDALVWCGGAGRRLRRARPGYLDVDDPREAHGLNRSAVRSGPRQRRNRERDQHVDAYGGERRPPHSGLRFQNCGHLGAPSIPTRTPPRS